MADMTCIVMGVLVSCSPLTSNVPTIDYRMQQGGGSYYYQPDAAAQRRIDDKAQYWLDRGKADCRRIYGGDNCK